MQLFVKFLQIIQSLKFSQIDFKIASNHLALSEFVKGVFSTFNKGKVVFAVDLTRFK